MYSNKTRIIVIVRRRCLVWRNVMFSGLYKIKNFKFSLIEFNNGYRRILEYLSLLGQGTRLEWTNC